MEVKINKEIQSYSESMFLGLSMRQCGFSLAAMLVAVGLYFLLKPYVGTETVSWMCILGAAPFAAMGFINYHGMTAEQVLWAWFKSEILCPKQLVCKSDSYYYEAMQPAIRVHLADLKDKVVGVSSGSTSARALVKAMIDEGVLDGANFDADTFNADTWKDGISFRQYDDYPAISTALSAGEVQGFCVDKSILAIYKTEGRSYIDAEFSPQEYGVATKKGSDFSTVCDDLIKGWLADGTIDQLIKDNGLD